MSSSSDPRAPFGGKAEPVPGARDPTAAGKLPRTSARRGPGGGAAASLGFHGALLGLLIAPALIRVPAGPVDPPTVDLVMGTSAAANGAPAPAPQPQPANAEQPAPQTAAQSAPPPVTPPAQTSLPPAPPVAPPAAEGKSDQPLPLPATSPPLPHGSVRQTLAASPVPPPPPMPRNAPATATAGAPPPPTRQVAPPTPTPATAAPAPASDFNIRLGDGIAAPVAQIEDAGLVRHAKADSGNVAPIYPADAGRRHETGTVVVTLRVGPDGSVIEALVTESSGSASLDAAARDRLATWHFHPAIRDGEPVNDIVEMSIHFVAQK